MSARIEVIESIEDKIEPFEPVHIELSFFDIGVICFYLDIGIKFACGLFCDLWGDVSQQPCRKRGSEVIQELSIS